ncbi:hypothetical protein Tco_0638297 [Tanacetum coccineum]
MIQFHRNEMMSDFDAGGRTFFTSRELLAMDGDPLSPLPPKKLHFEELKMIKYYIDDPSELELKDLPSHLEYAF